MLKTETNSAASKPFYDAEPLVSARDPAVYYDPAACLYRCWYTAVEAATNAMFVEEITSRELICWSAPRRLTANDGHNFSSPGNLVQTGGRYALCVQSYPITQGQSHGNADCRLWLMWGTSPEMLQAPMAVNAVGCKAAWSNSPRQIDPYLVQKDGLWYLFYKVQGCLGAMKSPDLKNFYEASVDRPVLAPSDTPDGATIENPCIVFTGGEYRMFFAPCRPGRGIGTAVSHDLLHWQDVHYLDFACPQWASGGPTAPFVLDDRAQWLLADVLSWRPKAAAWGRIGDGS